MIYVKKKKYLDTFKQIMLEIIQLLFQNIFRYNRLKKYENKQAYGYLCNFILLSKKWNLNRDLRYPLNIMI